VAKHLAKHRKPQKLSRQKVSRQKVSRRALKGRAVSMAGLIAGGLVLAPHTHAAAPATPTLREDVLLAAASSPGSVIFIDGNNYPNNSTRMDTQLRGKYVCTGASCAPPATGTNLYYINNTAVYPGTLGLYNGLGAPTGDQSIAAGQSALDKQITASPTPVTVVGYSEGAVAASHEVSALGTSNPNVSFVLIADAERPNGGILARMPAGTYIPLLGITGGNATSSTGAPVVVVTQQYDGVADAPAYPLNVVADTNAVLGFYYLHGNYYSVNPNAGPPATVVTTSPNGNMTDILVLAPAGKLPILMPLAQAGVPQPILVALDPATRAIIETGYARSSDPSQQVRFALLPPVSAWPGDAQAVVVGVVMTAQQLPGAVVASAPTLLVVAPLKTVSPVSSLSPVTAPPLNLSAPHGPTNLTAQKIDTSQVQTNGAAKTPSNEETSMAEPTATPPGPSDPKTKPVKSSQSEPTSKPTAFPKGTRSSGPDMKSGNMFIPQPTSTGGGTPSNGSNPVTGALTGVTNAIGSLAGGLQNATSASKTSDAKGGKDGGSK
jgi:hypothetical protein